MMETVYVTERNWERALRYGKERIDVKLRQKHRKSATAEIIGLYLVRYCVIIIVDEIARAVDASVKKGWLENFASVLVEIFKTSTIQIDLRLFWEVAGQYVESVLVTEVLLAFVKAAYMMV